MTWDRAHDRVLTSLHGMEGGEEPGLPFESLRLVDVELDPLGHISDQMEYRFLVGYHQVASLLPEHRGVEGGRVGTVEYKRLEDGRLRLVNLGPRSSKTNAPEGVGFPICTVCGEARSPFASQREIEDFNEGHEERCGRAISWVALHADARSELLILGPFEEDPAAINAVVALQLGIRRTLETGDQDLEALTLKEEDDRKVGVLFDPMPGGSGLLPLLKENWTDVIQAAREILQGCDCETACYRCLLTFRNQQHHGELNRHVALNALGDIEGSFKQEYPFPRRSSRKQRIPMTPILRRRSGSPNYSVIRTFLSTMRPNTRWSFREGPGPSRISPTRRRRFSSSSMDCRSPFTGIPSSNGRTGLRGPRPGRRDVTCWRAPLRL